MSNDVSLEDELLQVTEKKTNKKAQKKSKKAKYDEDEEEEEEDYESIGDEESDHKNGKRKPKSDSKKPLKKRKTDDSEGESSEDEAYDDGWDQDLMGDEEDRDRLAALPEIEREAIIGERYEKRKEARAAWEVKRRLKEEQRGSRGKESRESGKKESKRETRESRESKDSKDRASKRDRTATKSDSKGKALSELKKRRAKAGYKKSVGSDSDFDEVEDGEVEETKDDNYSPKKSTFEERETSKASKEEEEEDTRGGFDDEDDQTPISFEEVKQLMISRETLEKWVDKPFFESLLPGFFVRIGIGMDPATRMNVYRMAQVEQVETKSSYPFGGKTTNRWLKLIIGDKGKEFKMETISNRPFSESEYKHWRMQMERSSRKMPVSSEVSKRLETLTAAKDYQYTSEDIEKMLAQKKEAGVLPVKLAAEKARLILQREATADPEEKQVIVDRINRIEDQMKDKAAKKKGSSSVLNINQRNREANFFATLEAKEQEKNPNSDLDPFSRRRTIPTIVVASKYKVEDDSKTQNGTNNPANKNPSATPLKSSGTLPDSGKASEHDVIDIDISLDSAPLPFAPTAPSSISRPPSSLPPPTTPPFVSTPPPTEEKKEKKSTLSLNDYMERRRRAQE